MIRFSNYKTKLLIFVFITLDKIKSRGSIILEGATDEKIFRVIPGITATNVKARSPLMKHFDCLESGLFMQLFVARTEKLAEALWDPELGMNEHYDWLLNVKARGLKTIACNAPKLELKHITGQCTGKSGYSAKA